MTWTASEMGKKGGASTSPDKVRTARENAKKGETYVDSIGNG
jgi:hypothetical protein